MKRVTLILAMLLVVAPGVVAQLVKVATLVVDYNKYTFEGGALTEYKCLDCANETLPFAVDYRSPGDFGSITFTLLPTQDTVFHGTIIWMGTGRIYFPPQFSLEDPFVFVKCFAPLPSVITYYTMEGKVTTDSVFIKQALPAWDAIKSLLITCQFASQPYHAAIYLYPPSVGVFNPNVAKWIVFLYMKENTVSGKTTFGDMPIQIFYHSDTGIVSIISGSANFNEFGYQIIDTKGIVVKSGEVKEANCQIDIFRLPVASYLILLYDKKGRLLRTQKFIKP